MVALTDATSVKTKGGFLRSGKNYGQTVILRGLNLEVEGRGDGAGQLTAEKIRFGDSDLRVARSLEARVDPVESRVGTAEGAGQVEQKSHVCRSVGRTGRRRTPRRRRQGRSGHGR